MMMKEKSKNTETSRKIFINFSSLTSGKLLGDLFIFLLFVVLSRTFGKEGIGQYSFAMAITGFFAVLAEFGLYSYMIKEIGRRIETFRESYGKILSLKLILTLCVYVILLISLPLIPVSYQLKLIIGIIGAYQLNLRLVEILGATFIADGKGHFAGILEMSSKASVALIGVLAITMGGSLILTLTTLPFIAFGFIFVAYGLVTRMYGRPKLVFSRLSLVPILKNATPYAFSLFLFQIYSRFDVVCLGFILGTVSAGIYSVAYRVIFLVMFIPHFASISILPSASKLYVTSKSDFKLLYQTSLNFLILIGVPAAAGLYLIAPDCIKFIFGNNFIESASLLRLLSGLFFLTCLSRIMGVFLMASDRQMTRTKCQAIAASVNVIANMILIPTIGIKGAAISILLSESFLIVIFALRLKEVVGWPPVASRLAISCIATASFCIPFAIWHSLPIFLVILGSIIIYSTTLILFREIRENEIRTFLGAIRGV